MTRESSYRLFVDSANKQALDRWLKTGCIYGVTTNPSLLKRADVDCDIDAIRELALFALDAGAREFQAQVWGTSAEAYVDTGRRLSAISPSIVVKLPMCDAGLRAARVLRDDGTAITMTAVYTAAQAVAAVALGADYLAPYHGRLGDSGQDADAVVSDMLSITRAAPGTRVLVASVRSGDVVGALAAAGCDTLTVSPEVLEQVIVDPASAAAITQFEQDAAG